MRVIAHRGLLKGPDPLKENKIESILECIKLGFDVEIDVRLIDGEYWLGHDIPQEKVSIAFLESNKQYLWIHAKDILTFEALLNFRCLDYTFNVFFHHNDDCALTSKHYIWTYPRLLPLTNKSIAVMVERVPDWDLTNCAGICTDYPIHYFGALF